MLNRRFIERKIKLIQEEMHHLEPFSDVTFDEVARDSGKFAALERYLERLITRAIDINQHILAELGDGSERIRKYRDTFLSLPKFNIYSEDFAARIAQSAGLRNRLVHDYNDTNPKIIFRSVSDALRDYTQYCDAILKFIDQRKDE